ncbi:MAG: hypothetical protein AAGF93_05420 [Cyanobacteria bacterium P01_H01_bin.105]
MANQGRRKDTYYMLVGQNSYAKMTFYTDITEGFLTKAGWTKAEPENKALVATGKGRIVLGGFAVLYKVSYERAGGRSGSVSIPVSFANSDTFPQQANGDNYKTGAKITRIIASVKTTTTVG